MANDLERLRREGAARLADAEQQKRARQDEEANDRLEHDHAIVRLAIGRYRYRTLRTGVFWGFMPALPLFGVALASAAFEIATDVWGPILLISAVWLFGGLWLWASEIVWRASNAAMREEREWLDTLPFPMTGYYEWLRRSDHKEASVRVEIEGPTIGRQSEDVRVLFAAIHPIVSMEKRSGTKVEFTLTDIHGRDDDQRARVLHELVDRVLTPLFEESPFTSVKLS